VQPVATKELQALQQQLIASFNSVFPGTIHPTDLKFHPHVTVAYRDLSFEMFKQAWEEYRHKSFHASFRADAVYLLQHDSRKWNIISTHHLS
jgi:2'-5' RNA ligase